MDSPRPSDVPAAEAPAALLPTVLVLGPCALAGVESPAGVELTAVQRTILSRLAIAGDDVVGRDALTEAVWGSEPPASATAALHNQMSRIRRRLGAGAVITVAGGYQLCCPTDRAAADRLLELSSAALERGDPAAARATAQQALESWRGTPLDDLSDLPAATRERLRLAEVRRSLENLRLTAAIAEGSHAWAVPEAERLVADTPFDEHRWILLIRTLDLAGRRGDALGAFERARRILAEGLGLSPGPALLAAEAAVLRDPSTRDQTRPGRLIGRRELADAALPLLHDTGALVLTGEPGVGKTRLLAEICGIARRAGAAVGRTSVSWHPSSAIATLADLAEDLAVDLDTDVPPLVAFRAAIESRMDSCDSLVLCVDDLDRAGPTSVAALIDAISIEGVSLLAAATEPGLLPVVLDRTELAVPALDQDQVAQLVAARSDLDRPDPSLVTWLFQMSGGNPMLVEYLLEHPVGQRRRSTDGSPEPVGSPELRDMIRARVQRLGTSTLAALEVAAVCGPRSNAKMLAELVPWSGIEGGVAAELLEDVGDDSGERWVTFRHGAVQRTIYDDLTPGRRTEIHHRAAEVLESLGAPAATIATHAVAAAHVDPVIAADRAIAAALAATELGAHDDAARWYERAIDAAGVGATAGMPGAVRSHVVALVGRGDALRLAGSSEQNTALFAAAEAAFALGAADLVGDAAFAVLQLGTTTESGSLHADAIDVADRALAVVTDPDQRARISAAASLTHSMTGAPDRCRELFVDAERLATSDAARRQVLPFTYLGLGHPRDLAERERLTQELIERGRAAHDPVALFEGNQLSFSVGLTRQRGDQVRSALAEQASLVVHVGDVGRRWQLEYQRAALAHLDGDLDGAELHAQGALAMFGDVSPSRAFAVYGAQLLPIRIAQGRLAELLDTLEGLVADQPGVPAWHAALALALAPVDRARALAHATSALEDVAEDFTWLAAHVIGGRRGRGGGRGAVRHVPRAPVTLVGAGVLAGNLLLRPRRHRARPTRRGHRPARGRSPVRRSGARADRAARRPGVRRRAHGAAGLRSTGSWHRRTSRISRRAPSGSLRSRRPPCCGATGSSGAAAGRRGRC